MPELRSARPPPAHATHPLQVTQDFSSQDWKERERERDRLDALAGASSGSGQNTALGRARDKKGEQTPHHVFQHYTDTWFRTLTEDDLAWLSAKVSEAACNQRNGLESPLEALALSRKLSDPRPRSATTQICSRFRRSDDTTASSGLPRTPTSSASAAPRPRMQLA